MQNVQSQLAQFFSLASFGALMLIYLFALSLEARFDVQKGDDVFANKEHCDIINVYQRFFFRNTLDSCYTRTDE